MPFSLSLLAPPHQGPGWPGTAGPGLPLQGAGAGVCRGKTPWQSNHKLQAPRSFRVGVGADRGGVSADELGAARLILWVRLRKINWTVTYDREACLHKCA